MILYACSSNPGKLREFALAASGLPGADVRVELLPGLTSIPAPDETGATFEDNASLKAVYYSQATPELVFAEDSGLEVDALGGEPGVFSARFAGSGADDLGNNRLLLQKMHGKKNRSARFVSVVALAKAGQVIRTFRGEVEGEIADEPRGNGGFGYDPLFFFPPHGRTLAEVSAEQKLSVSHRGQAFRKLLLFVSQASF